MDLEFWQYFMSITILNNLIKLKGEIKSILDSNQQLNFVVKRMYVFLAK